MSYISRMPLRSNTPVGQTALNPLHIFIVYWTILHAAKIPGGNIFFLDICWPNFKCQVPPEPLSYLLFIISSVLLQVFHVFVAQLELPLLLASLESFPSWDNSAFQRHTFSLHWCPEHFQKVKCQELCVNDRQEINCCCLLLKQAQFSLLGNWVFTV